MPGKTNGSISVIARLRPTGWPRRSRGVDRLQPKSLFDALAHEEFLRLASDGHREGIDEFDVARNFLVSDLPAAEFPHLVAVIASPSRSLIQAQSSSPYLLSATP